MFHFFALPVCQAHFNSMVMTGNTFNTCVIYAMMSYFSPIAQYDALHLPLSRLTTFLFHDFTQPNAVVIFNVFVFLAIFL